MPVISLLVYLCVATYDFNLSVSMKCFQAIICLNGKQVYCKLNVKAVKNA